MGGPCCQFQLGAGHVLAVRLWGKRALLFHCILLRPARVAHAPGLVRSNKAVAASRGDGLINGGPVQVVQWQAGSSSRSIVPSQQPSPCCLGNTMDGKRRKRDSEPNVLPGRAFQPSLSKVGHTSENPTGEAQAPEHQTLQRHLTWYLTLLENVTLLHKTGCGHRTMCPSPRAALC